MAVSTQNVGKPGPRPEPTPEPVESAEKPVTIAGHVPSFIPAGTQAELDATGEATNPFTGERLTGPIKRVTNVNTPK